MSQTRLLLALIASKNEAADDVFVEALRHGNLFEQTNALDGIIRRGTVRGMGGAIGLYEKLDDSLKLIILGGVKKFHHAIRECARSDDLQKRLSALRLIALGRQGKLAYVLSENLHDADERIAQVACEAMIALAKWVATETKSLQRSGIASRIENGSEEADDALRRQSYANLNEQRGEIESAVARALDAHRGKQGAELLRAALLLCDWPGSKTLAILNTQKHGGQSPMVRRLQQPPASEHVDAFLLGATHGGLRSHFGSVFAHIDEAPVLDAVLRRSHWLKDNNLQLCMHQVSRGTWWVEHDLIRDFERRPPEDAVTIADWLACSGMHDVMQDSQFERLRQFSSESFDARLRLLRLAMSRRRGASVEFIRAMLADPDERLMRIAARELVRRRPADFENILLQLMTNAPTSVRRVISRAIGQVGFDHFWNRFDRMDKPTRKHAGRAMMKLLPDAVQRLNRKLTSGTPEQRIKALSAVHELELSSTLRVAIESLCSFNNSRVRSKAISVLGEIDSVGSEILLDKVLNDSDPRVRANAIEVLEARRREDYVPMLMQRARSANNRERANAIKAMSRMKVSTAASALVGMMRDQRSEHRISAMWALRQIGWWQLLTEVGRLAKEDGNLRVRKYAMNVLRGASAAIRAQQPGAQLKDAG